MATTMLMPRELRFVHNDAPFMAILVDDVPLSTAPCCLCGRSLQGQAFYTTSPPMFDVHAECASSFFHHLSGAAGDGCIANKTDRSFAPGAYYGGYYYYYPYAAVYPQNYYYQWHGNQQAQGSFGHQTSGSSWSSFAQRFGSTVIGSFIQALISTMAGGLLGSN